MHHDEDDHDVIEELDIDTGKLRMSWKTLAVVLGTLVGAVVAIMQVLTTLVTQSDLRKASVDSNGHPLYAPYSDSIQVGKNTQAIDDLKARMTAIESKLDKSSEKLDRSSEAQRSLAQKLDFLIEQKLLESSRTSTGRADVQKAAAKVRQATPPNQPDPLPGLE